MAQPILSLYKDYQDINLDNYKIVAEYDALIRQAYATNDFTTVQSFIDNNSVVLRQVVRTASDRNQLVQYVEDLKKYIIARKNQVHIVDADVTDEELSDEIALLLPDCDTGDLIIYEKTSLSSKYLKIDLVGENSTLIPIYECANSCNTYYINCSLDMIKDLANTGETINYVISQMGASDPDLSSNSMKSSYTSGYYIEIPNDVIPNELKNNDIISLNTPYFYGTLSETGIDIIAIKIKDKFYQIVSTEILPNRTYEFIYLNNGAECGIDYYKDPYSKSERYPSSYIKFIRYDESGKPISYDSSAFVGKNNDTRNLAYNGYSLKYYLDNYICNNIWITPDTTNTVYYNDNFNLRYNKDSNFIEFVEPLQYMIKNNNLYLRFKTDFIKNNLGSYIDEFYFAITTNGVNIFTLPDECRPSKDSFYTCMSFNDKHLFNIKITTNGDIILYPSFSLETFANQCSSRCGGWNVDIICPLD